MRKKILTIKGDHNDADYITREREIDLDALAFPTFNDRNMNKVLMVDFVLELAEVLKENKRLGNRHNWNREEFDDSHVDKIKTTVALYNKLSSQKIDVNKIDFDILEEYNDEEKWIAVNEGEEPEFDWEDSEFIFELSEEIQNYLPYDDCGIHTISSITLKPIVQDITVLFDEH